MVHLRDLQDFAITVAHDMGWICRTARLPDVIGATQRTNLRFGFGPGLRRLSDYHRLGPYTLATRGIDNSGTAEMVLGNLYFERLGHRAVALPGSSSVRHIGVGRGLPKELPSPLP
jgi:hypothetical protein